MLERGGGRGGPLLLDQERLCPVGGGDPADHIAVRRVQGDLSSASHDVGGGGAGGNLILEIMDAVTVIGVIGVPVKLCLSSETVYSGLQLIPQIWHFF